MRADKLETPRFVQPKTFFFLRCISCYLCKPRNLAPGQVDLYISSSSPETSTGAQPTYIFQLPPATLVPAATSTAIIASASTAFAPAPCLLCVFFFSLAVFFCFCHGRPWLPVLGHPAPPPPRRPPLLPCPVDAGSWMPGPGCSSMAGALVACVSWSPSACGCRAVEGPPRTPVRFIPTMEDVFCSLPTALVPTF